MTHSRPTHQLLHVREGTQRLHTVGALAAERLRAEVYIDHRGWIAASERNQHGGETDHFDDAATHFAVITGDPGESAVACMRMVRPVDNELPILGSFPELAEGIGSCVEVSRYIARDPASSLALRAVITAHLLRTDKTGIALMSTGLRTLLRRQDFLLRDLTQPRVVPRFGRRPQVAVVIDADSSARLGAVSELIGRALNEDWPGVLAGAEELTND